MTGPAPRLKKPQGLVLAVALLLFVSIMVIPVAATSMTINSSTSINATIAGAASGDTIILQPGIYRENGIIVDKSIIIRAADGHGPEDTIIDGKSAAPRIFTVTGPYSITIDHLALRNGRAEDGSNGSPGGNASYGESGENAKSGGNGGAISSYGPVTILASRITDSGAGNGGSGGDAGTGGPGGWGGYGGYGGMGGAIFSNNSVTVAYSTISGCLGGNGGKGGNGGNIFSGGSGGYGGAISSEGPVTILASGITDSRAGDGGPGGSGGPGGPGGSGGLGGAIFSGKSVTITDSTISGCLAGNGNIGSPGRNIHYGGYGGPGGYGGAIMSIVNATVTNSTISKCSAGNGAPGGPDGYGGHGGYGGAISSVGSVTVSDSTISGCSAGNGGPSGPDGYSGEGGDGGAIWSYYENVTVTDSTISGCSAGNGGTGGRGGYGGNGGAIWFRKTITVTGSSLTGCSSGIGGTNRDANGEGNGIYTNIGSGSIHFCDLLANGHNGTVVAGMIDATNNWWGTNKAPVEYTGNGAQSIPWLVLGITADPAQIVLGNTSTVRANLTFNSDGNYMGGKGTVPAGIPVSFITNSDCGNLLDPVTGTMMHGTAATIFRPKCAGQVTISAIAGDQVVSTDVTAMKSKKPVRSS